MYTLIRSLAAFALCTTLFLASPIVQAHPQKPLLTRWASDVDPERPWPEYPRPAMVRERWMNLNGRWEYGIVPRGQSFPPQPDGEILVPFAAESTLSGVGRSVGEDHELWYRPRFRLPEDWGANRILLHFGAVDWETRVWVNGREIGSHRGGYDPFSFDITDALKPEGQQEIRVAVWDPIDTGSQPLGKQVRRPRSIWYTSVTGIWQTVWLEPVANTLDAASLREVSMEHLEARAGELDADSFRRARHVVSENARVVEAVEALRRGDLRALGKLMNDSHTSLRDDYEVSSPELDEVVATARGRSYPDAFACRAGDGATSEDYPPQFLA